MVKQVIVMRKDLQMTKGKIVAQGSHASLAVILKMFRSNESIDEFHPEINNGKYELNLRFFMQ